MNRQRSIKEMKSPDSGCEWSGFGWPGQLYIGQEWALATKGKSGKQNKQAAGIRIIGRNESRALVSNEGD